MKLVDKHTSNHPWRQRICDIDKCFSVNGEAGKILHVRRGRTYKFKIDIDQKVHHPTPFYLTSDPCGGVQGDMAESTHDPVKLPGTFEPTSNGEVTLRVAKDFPQFAYYQSRQHKFMGGLIVCHDG